jgi:hypothetical protein
VVAALCRSYASQDEALQAVDAVLGAGIPGEDVLVLIGERSAHDTHEAPVGEFAGPTEPDAPVGEFAGGPVPRGTDEGAFAGGEQRGGSFADTDRELLTSYPDGVERMRVLGHRRITRLLTDAGLDEATAKRDVDELHRGRVLVLVDVADDDADRVAPLLEG